MEFNRYNAQAIQRDLEKAAEAVARKHGLRVEPGGRFTYYDDHVSVSVEFYNAGETKEGNQALEFKTLARHYGLQPSDLGKTFNYKRKSYTIVGLNVYARKMPVLTKDERGKSWAWDAKSVRELLAGEDLSD